MKAKNRRVIITGTLVCALLLTSTIVSAALPALVVVGLAAIAEAFARLAAMYLERGLYIFAMGVIFHHMIPSMYTDIIHWILMNPPIIDSPDVENMVFFFVHLTYPLYVLAIVLTGLYMLLVSTSPRGRARAKGSLIRLILGMVVIVITIPLIQLLMDVSEGFTSLVLNLADEEIAISAFRDVINKFFAHFAMLSFGGGLEMGYMLLFMALIMFIPFITMALRYLMIIFWTLLFPFTILLYSFEFTQGMGKAMLRQTLAWIFVQVLYAFVIVAIAVGVAAVPSTSPVPIFFIEYAAVMLLIIVPFIMLGVMDWIAAAIIFGIPSLVLEASTMVDEMQIEKKEIKEK